MSASLVTAALTWPLLAPVNARFKPAALAAVGPSRSSICTARSSLLALGSPVCACKSPAPLLFPSASRLIMPSTEIGMVPLELAAISARAAGSKVVRVELARVAVLVASFAAASSHFRLFATASRSCPSAFTAFARSFTATITSVDTRAARFTNNASRRRRMNLFCVRPAVRRGAFPARRQDFDSSRRSSSVRLISGDSLYSA
mmetsp:Transcript_5835/g.13507  ORF Transcript_5835/g.13507 Transcript_5835/m.13507 type:complete len:203 (+) Transcript_5835:326-934(+)